jgi:3',5'-cyclic AMP phosphodiesterase CpdA
MKTIIHLSDLHFGRNNREVLRAVYDAVMKIKPDILVVSGDLTQRAKVGEFKAAKEFLNKFKVKKIVIPGNHDVPLYNVLNRVLRPFARYKKYISKNLQPFYSDSEVAIIGVNTARPTRVTRGRINDDQAQLIKKYFQNSKKAVKIVVAHHPFDLPDKFSKRKIVLGAAETIKHLVEAEVDLILGGHMHVSHARSIADRYKVDGKAALVVQASTVSLRTRGEAPTFNVLKIRSKKISVIRYGYTDHKFEPDLIEDFTEKEGNWVK